MMAARVVWQMLNVSEPFSSLPADKKIAQNFQTRLLWKQQTFLPIKYIAFSYCNLEDST
jgi:hypothetical protein